MFRFLLILPHLLAFHVACATIQAHIDDDTSSLNNNLYKDYDVDYDDDDGEYDLDDSYYIFSAVSGIKSIPLADSQVNKGM